MVEGTTWESQNTCLDAQKPATNKRFNGWGFTAPPTYPDLKESGGQLKGERLPLMEKPHVSISGCKPPGSRAPQSEALSLCAAETWARGGGSEWRGRRHPRLSPVPGPGRPRQLPRGSPSSPGPEAVCISTWLQGAAPDRYQRACHCPPPTGRGPTGCS